MMSSPWTPWIFAAAVVIVWLPYLAVAALAWLNTRYPRALPYLAVAALAWLDTRYPRAPGVRCGQQEPGQQLAQAARDLRAVTGGELGINQAWINRYVLMVDSTAAHAPNERLRLPEAAQRLRATAADRRLGRA